MENSGTRDIWKPKNSGGIDTTFLVGVATAGAAVFLLWWTPLLFPFRIFTTIVHELSHALAAIITGGSVSRVEVNPNGSGLTFITGGFGLLVASAGYLGSTLVGGLMLLLAKRPQGRRNVLYGIVAVLVLALIFFVRDPETLVLFAIVGAVYGLAAWRAPDILVTFLLYTTALLGCLYAVFDLITVITINFNPFGGHNDAQILQAQTGIPAPVWALLWGAVGVIIIFQFVRMALRQSGVTKKSVSEPKSPFDKYLQ